MSNLAKVIFAILLLVPSSGYSAPLPSVGQQLATGEDRKWITEDPCVLAYTIRDRHLFCTASGQTVTTPQGASMTFKYLEEDIQAVGGRSFVESKGYIPSGATLYRCLVITKNAVSGGYYFGLEDGADWFATMPSTANETNLDYDKSSGPMPIYENTKVRISSVSTAFASSTGKVRFSCFYALYGAPE